MPSLDVEGIWREWDTDEEMREVFRAGEKFLKPPACADISTCVKYGYLLRPLLSRMALKEDRPLPPVEQLREELEELFQHNKQGLEIEFLEISKKTWALKKLCGFVKTKARRREVSTATGLQARFGKGMNEKRFWKYKGLVTNDVTDVGCCFEIFMVFRWESFSSLSFSWIPCFRPVFTWFPCIYLTPKTIPIQTLSYFYHFLSFLAGRGGLGQRKGCSEVEEERSQGLKMGGGGLGTCTWFWGV